MHVLDTALEGLLPERADTVLHLGAGQNVNRVALRPSAARRWVLVEGDPGRAALLRQSAALVQPTDGSVSIVECVVSATGGPVAWHRHTLSALDGVMDMSPLTLVYPRLRLVERQMVDSMALATLVDQIVPPNSTGAQVLLLDLPGQEHFLLQALGLQRLERFSALIVCGCTHWPAAAALAELSASGWSCLPDADALPLWPIHRLRRQPAGSGGIGRQALQVQDTSSPVLDAVRNELARTEQALALAMQELRQLRTRDTELGSWQADRARLTASLDAARQELHDLQDLHLRETTHWKHTLETERERHDALRRQLAQAEAQIGMLKDLLLRDDAL